MLTELEENLQEIKRQKDLYLKPENIVEGVTILDVEGAVVPQHEIQLQDKTVTPSTQSQDIDADDGYDGLGTVTVEGDNDLVANNIKKDVTIFGVTGTYEAPTPSINLQDKTVTPRSSSQTVTADSGYDGLDEVTVNGDSNLIPSNIKKNVDIFGVTGTYEGSGGGSSDLNIYVQHEEPESKNGIWIDDTNSVVQGNSNDVKFLNYITVPRRDCKS